MDKDGKTPLKLAPENGRNMIVISSAGVISLHAKA